MGIEHSNLTDESLRLYSAAATSYRQMAKAFEQNIILADLSGDQTLSVYAEDVAIALAAYANHLDAVCEHAEKYGITSAAHFDKEHGDKARLFAAIMIREYGEAFEEPASGCAINRSPLDGGQVA